MSPSNITKIQCKITDSSNTTLEGSVYLEKKSDYTQQVRIVLDPTLVDDKLRRNFSFPAIISGTNELGEEFFIPKFWRSSGIQHYHPKYTVEWVGFGEVIYKGVGLDTKIIKGQEVSIQLAIPFSALTTSEPNFDQKLGELNIQESSPISMSWKNGMYSYSLYNLFTTDLETGNDNSIINVKKKSFITIQFLNTKRTTFKEAVSAAIAAFENDQPLLGFLGKRRIDWYELEAASIIKSASPPVLEISAWKPVPLSENNPFTSFSLLDVPISLEVLNKGVMDTLLHNLHSHSNKGAITRAIEYLLSSYEEKYLFSKLVAAYTAFETLVTELGSTQKLNTALSSGQYKELSEIIRDYLDENVEDNEKKSAIQLKMPELKRPPIKLTFQKLFNQQEYPQVRFMFNNTSWSDNIGALLSRRNKLVHAGEISQEHYLDLFRLHLLLQLWILKLLGCPDKYVNDHLANPVRNFPRT